LTVVIVLGLFAAIALHHATGVALGQRMKPGFLPPGDDGQPTNPDDDGDLKDGITLPTDRKLKGQLAVATEFILHDENWDMACRVLQKLLDNEQDVFVELERVGPDGKKSTHWTSVRSEANRLLAMMPEQGLEVYELRSGGDARKLLEQAKASGDPQILAKVAQQYFHTKAGLKATKLLGTHHLDRKNYVMAALCFKRLLDPKHAKDLEPLDLVKAHVAFKLAGDKQEADAAWQRLSKAFPAGVKLGSRRNPTPLEDLAKEIDRLDGGETVASAYDYPMFKGNRSRSAQGIGDKPFLDEDTKRWYQEIGTKTTTNLVNTIHETQEKRQNRTPLPAFFPIAANGKLVYRSYSGVSAVDLRTGKLSWEQPSKWSYEKMMADAGVAGMVQQWWNQYTTGGQQSILFENSVLGTLSTDYNYVYHIDDMAVPPHPMHMMNMGWGGPRANYGPLEAIVHHNKLQAVELDTGKLKWIIGDRGGDKDVNDSFFLGAPLPLGGKLYVLNEKDSSLRLLCLDPATGEMVWQQKLADVRDRLPKDVSRRIHACHLAYGEGILVCPTNAGAVLGVDLLSRSLVWAYSYREGSGSAEKNPPNPFGGWNPRMPVSNLTSNWKSSAPVVVDGKVVFTAPDGESVHCLNLRDGNRIWKANREDSLYLGGVYAGKVVLVGKNSCRALNLADGKQAWSLETGVPSGHGIASDNMFYLPLKAAAQGKEPEVCVIDIEKGHFVAHTKTRRGEIPGNLLFYDGKVLSQTTKQVVAYPQLKAKIREIDELISKNPNDPVGLTQRAELRLHDGNVLGAVQDLQLALNNNPDNATLPKTRAKLFDSLTELFQRDFDTAAKEYMATYEDMCNVPIPQDAGPAERQRLLEEQQRRQANFLCLVAKGRERQGNLAEAFRHYMKFGGLANRDELLSVLDEPSVKARPDVWAQGRIAAMIAKATPEQAEPLRKEIAKQWDEIKQSNDVTKLREFVQVFGSLFDVGKEARLQLADKLLENNAFLEAEMQYLHLRDDKGPLGGRAVEGLARLMLRRNAIDDAIWWYRILARDYENVEIRDGKTGADFLNDLTTDKRFLSHIDDWKNVWGGGKMRAREEVGNAGNPNNQFHCFRPIGEAVPAFQRNRVFFYHQQMALKVVDCNGTTERFSQILTPRPGNLQYVWQLQQFPHLDINRFQVKGHVGVISLGTMVYCFDLMDNKIRWTQSLLGSESMNPNTYINIDQNGKKSIVDSNFGTAQPFGDIGTFAASHVSIVTRDGLLVVEPLTGKTLWTKSDVSETTRIFGDDQYLFLVDHRLDGSVGNARVLRAHDGVSVDAPDYLAIYQKRHAILGRNLLVADSDGKGGTKVRLYDPLTGKDVWKKEFSSKTMLLSTEEPNLIGTLEAGNQGKVTVFDLVSQKPILEAAVDPKDVEKAKAVHLLRDNERFYLAIENPSELNMWDGPFNNTMALLPVTRVNGKFYAFTSQSKLAWKVDLADQFLLMDQYKDLPVLIFSSRNNGQRRGGQVRSFTRSVDKRTGKLVYSGEHPNQWIGFMAYNINIAERTIELIGQNVKIRHFVEESK
jgi:outer membrane protein assembly factor BamB